ncbi:hypothetical protein BHE74_00040032 [Ensete ventricosum]|nr:hypothetical protein BHE74_00040032 [Ensete ventricosum]
MQWDLVRSSLGDSPKEAGGKLAGNAKGDRRKEDQRTCRKIARVCGTGIRKVEGTTFAKISTGKPPVSDGWTTRTTESKQRPTGVGG